MKIEKLHITKEKTDINLNFYFFLKLIVKLKATNNQVLQVLENLNLFKNDIDELIERFNDIFAKSQNKLELIQEISLRLTKQQDIEIFDFSLRLCQIKDLLLQEAKISETLDLNSLSKLDPLSLEYDKISVLKPYKTRVSGALLSLLFFEKINEGNINLLSVDAIGVLKQLSKQVQKLQKQGLESNQIFMLMFSESINQSIISDSGSNYESRILSVLNTSGIKNITKVHDKGDKSTEYDFFFEIDNKTYGIGAKRTLRERYKQFIKTAHTSKIDVSIEITIGLDLNEEKAKTIVQHDTYIFVADEVYNSREYLKKMHKVYSAKNLNIETLKKIGSGS